MTYEPEVHNSRMAPETSKTEDAATALHLPNLAAFTVVAHELNFARAATRLQITPTAMSKTIRLLETQLGLRLFNRTTRSVALTDAGQELLATLAPALDRIRASVEQVRASSSRPAGTLRINSSYVAYASLVEPHLATFLTRYPDMRIELSIDNGLSDIVASGFDAGIRLGHALQRDMVAVPLGPPQQQVVVASPRYLKQHGMPKAPSDLLAHDCIRQRLGSGGRLLEWIFQVAAKPVRIDVQGRLVFSEMLPALAAARAGAGLAYVFRQFAQPDIDSGALALLLDRYCPARESFHLYYPHRAQMSAKLRLFVDFIRGEGPHSGASSPASGTPQTRRRPPP